MKTEPNEIDQSLGHDGYLFRTHFDQCRHIGMSRRYQRKWLKDHPDAWKRLQDVQQETSSDPGLAENASPVPAKAAAPSSRASAQKVQNNGRQGGTGSVGVDSRDGPAPRQSARASVPPMAVTASSAPRDKDEIMIGGRRYVSSKLPCLDLGDFANNTLPQVRCRQAPPKIKISGDYFELPDG
jgi:hypothetical protein